MIESLLLKKKKVISEDVKKVEIVYSSLGNIAKKSESLKYFMLET